MFLRLSIKPKLRVQVWTLVFFMLLIHVAEAANLVGFLVYAPSTENDNSQSQVTAFSEIYWQSADGGSVINMEGSPVPFKSTNVAQFVYLSEEYWSQMDSNSTYKPYRMGIISREIVIPSLRTDITSDDDIHPFVIGSQTLASIVKIDPDFTAVLAPLRAEQDSEVAHYQSGERKVNNNWVSAQAFESRTQEATAATSNANSLDITTLDGKLYKNVTHVKLDDDTISFLYEDGGATVEMAMLPPYLQKRFAMS